MNGLVVCPMPGSTVSGVETCVIRADFDDGIDFTERVGDDVLKITAESGEPSPVAALRTVLAAPGAGFDLVADQICSLSERCGGIQAYLTGR